MKLGTVAALAAAGAALLIAAPAWAQSLTAPPGSYRDSCTNIRVTPQGGGRLLSARCRTTNGGSNNTSLRIENCRGDIANDNGRLVCRTGGGGGGGGAIPNGSFRQSCNNARMQGTVLSADCRDTRGRYNRTSLDTRNCRGDIGNDNGRLVCSSGGGGGGGGSGQVPNGTFQRSCTNASMQGWTLTATCQRPGGGTNRTSIDTRTCRGGDIANSGGRLVCMGGPGGGGGGGNRPGSITLCTQLNFTGRCETITRSASSLGPWSMSNRARSARVNGRWEVCDQQNFGRPCTVLNRNVSDLRQVRFDRIISSVRPR